MNDYEQQLQQDYINECLDDAKLCPDCGIYMETHGETTPEHNIVTIYICPKCGAESEEV
jgi:ribosomal protein S27AE